MFFDDVLEKFGAPTLTAQLDQGQLGHVYSTESITDLSTFIGDLSGHAHQWLQACD